MSESAILDWEQTRPGDTGWSAFDRSRFLLGSVVELHDGWHGYLWGQPVGRATTAHESMEWPLVGSEPESDSQ
ncbi:MAG TPA: hypothetical protein PKE56_16590 [Acidimicrobiales bacterium]|jgi:hypothetical protein|nr:hypothetical protein [Acidimicrobiales bacterium]